MDKNNTKKQNVYISEEEKTLNWEDVQNSFKKSFGNEIYVSWLQKISLIKEYNDYLILGVPTRFFRDWIVSRYLDKILEQVKSFKLSLNRIEFKIIEEGRGSTNLSKIDEINKVTEIKDSILNYNRLNPNLNFENFIQGKSNEIALSYSKKVCEHLSRYNPLYICGGVGLGKTHLLNAIGLELQEKNIALARSIYTNEIVKEEIGKGNSITITQKHNQLMMAQSQYISSMIELFQSRLSLDKLYNKILPNN